MAIGNHERVGKALNLLKNGLVPFVERTMKAQYGLSWLDHIRSSVTDKQERHLFSAKSEPRWDCAALLAVVLNQWHVTFKMAFGQAEGTARTLVNELRQVRNDWAHQKQFSTEDAYRAIDSVERLLILISAPHTEELRNLKKELFAEIRSEIDQRSDDTAPETGHLTDYGFTEAQTKDITVIISVLQRLGGVNIQVQPKGEDVFVIGEFDDGPNGMRTNGFLGSRKGEAYEWVVYLERLEDESS